MSAILPPPEVQRRKSVCNFGGTDLEKFGESASAEGAKLRAAIAEGKKPLTTRGSGEPPEADAIFNI